MNKNFGKRAYERIKNLYGLNVIEAPNLDSLAGHSAGSIKERVKSLRDFFKRKDIHGIMSFWGGFNSHQVLEHLDYDLFRQRPKVLIGYSDTTVIFSAINHKTGLVTFNYPMADTFSDNQWWTKDDMVFSKNPGWEVFKTGKAQGIVVGGNVGTLLLLAGTPYWPSMKGKILFIEDDEAEPPKTIDRFFTQLRHMGIYDQIVGLVVGRFPGCVGLNTSDSLFMILNDALKGFRIPVITGFDMGHTDPLLTVPIGARVELDASKKTITLLEAAVV